MRFSLFNEFKSEKKTYAIFYCDYHYNSFITTNGLDKKTMGYTVTKFHIDYKYWKFTYNYIPVDVSRAGTQKLRVSYKSSHTHMEE